MELTLDKITEAFKQDIADILERTPLNVYEFKRVEKVANIAARLCDGFNGDQLNARAQCFRSTENVAPKTHALLASAVIDGNPILAARYDDMKTMHTKLSIAALELAEQQDDLERRERMLERDGERLYLHSRIVTLEQKRLALSGGVVPAMPALPSLGEAPGGAEQALPELAVGGEEVVLDGKDLVE